MNLTQLTYSRCRKSAILLTLLAVGLTMPLFAQDLNVCLDSPAEFDAGTVKAFETELTAIARASGFSLHLLNQMKDCQNIKLIFKSQSKTDTSALSAQRLRRAGSLPEIEIYVTPIASLLKSRLPALLGRGMARVAAHEIERYFLDKSAHPYDHSAGSLSAGRLLVSENKSFRIPVTATASASNSKRP